MVLCLVLLAGAAVWWATRESPAGRSLYDDIPVTLEANGITLRQAFTNCSRQANLGFVAVAPGLDQKVSLGIVRGRFAAVLDNLCEIGSCEWEIIEQPQPILFIRSRTEVERKD